MGDLKGTKVHAIRSQFDFYLFREMPRECAELGLDSRKVVKDMLALFPEVFKLRAEERKVFSLLREAMDKRGVPQEYQLAILTYVYYEASFDPGKVNTRKVVDDKTGKERELHYVGIFQRAYLQDVAEKDPAKREKAVAEREGYFRGNAGRQIDEWLDEYLPRKLAENHRPGAGKPWQKATPAELAYMCIYGNIPPKSDDKAYWLESDHFKKMLYGRDMVLKQVKGTDPGIYDLWWAATHKRQQKKKPPAQFTIKTPTAVA